MLNFMKEMIKLGGRNRSYGFRIFPHILTKKGYMLSIQCSEFHYCSPREILALDAYSKFEVAIIKQGEFVYPTELNDFSRKQELDECFEGSVFGYVPKDLVEDLFNFLNEK